MAEPLQTAERLRYRELWGQLLSENAPLHVLNDDKLVSAPISFFDEMLTSLVTEHWRKVARIIGTAVADEMEDGIIQSDDTFLAARLDALARDGRLELRGGSAHDMHVSDVRLPGAQEPSYRGTTRIRAAPLAASWHGSIRGTPANSSLSPMVNRVLTSPYLWWFDLLSAGHKERSAAARGWHLTYGNDRFIPHAARHRQSGQRALAIRAVDRASGALPAV